METNDEGKLSQSASVKDFDVTTKETIELEVPSKRQKIVITITKRHFYDPIKKKVVSDQVVHRARYSLNKGIKGKGDIQ
jgi:hypothetical protein